MRICKTSGGTVSTSEIAQQGLRMKLVKELGGTYSSALDINLASMESEEVFKWFLASVLFGARIGLGGEHRHEYLQGV